MKPQVEPKMSSKIGILDFKKYLNIKEIDSFHLLIVQIISCFIFGISHPIITMTGSQGAAKSTGGRLIRWLVDPAHADMVSLPTERRDLIIQLNRGHMVFFDNIKNIKDDFNDIFCQAVTGGYQIARKLYTDDEIVAYKLQRCMIMNGIIDLTEKPDLLDRMISTKLERINEKNTLYDQDLFAEFEQDLPYFLGSVFNVISQAMSIYPNITLERKPRMADFARWGVAIATVLKIGGDNFMSEYFKNRNSISLELIQDNATAIGIIDFMAQVNKGQWKGSVKDFWTELETFAIRKKINRDDKTWAKTENVLGKRLEELKVSLEQQGVYFDKRNIGTNKELTIKYVKKQ